LSNIPHNVKLQKTVEEATKYWTWCVQAVLSCHLGIMPPMKCLTNLIACCAWKINTWLIFFRRLLHAVLKLLCCLMSEITTKVC